MTTNPYERLKQKEIIQILVGDTPCGEIAYDDLAFKDFFDSPRSISISMPRLSGQAICDTSTRLGFPMQYEAESKISRRKYFEYMLDRFIQEGRCSDLLSYLFDKNRFKNHPYELPPEKIDEYYTEIVITVLEAVNAILCDSGHELKIIGQKFVVQPSGTKLEVHAPMIERTIDLPYIADITARALQDLDAGHFDSALTKSKTLLEEVFKYVIEQKCNTCPKNDTITKLNKRFIDLYYLGMNKKNEQNTEELLHGVAKIVAAISELRNRNSDAHGHGSERTNDFKDYHARLVVNASITLADFILSVAQNNLSQK